MLSPNRKSDELVYKLFLGPCNMYEPLNKDWNIWNINRKLFPLKFDEFQEKLDSRCEAAVAALSGSSEYTKSKVFILAQKLFEASFFSYWLESFGEADGENIENTAKLLEECKSLLEELSQYYVMSELAPLTVCAKIIECDVSQVLLQFSVITSKLIARYYDKKKNCLKANESRMDILNFEIKLRNDLNSVYLIVRHAVYLLLDCWEEHKFFKQSNYLLYSAETLLERMTNKDDDNSDLLNQIMRFIFYAWIIYNGRLLDHSKYVMNEMKETEKCIEDLITKMDAVKFEEQLFTFDFKLNPKQYKFPDKLLKNCIEVQGVYSELINYKKMMKMWGPLQITETTNTYEMMDKLLEYAKNKFPYLI